VHWQLAQRYLAGVSQKRLAHTRGAPVPVGFKFLIGKFIHAWKFLSAMNSSDMNISSQTFEAFLGLGLEEDMRLGAGTEDCPGLKLRASNAAVTLAL
jgi:hypothetical protein